MPPSSHRNIADVRRQSRSGNLTAKVQAQIEELTKRESANGKSYWELKLRDAADTLVLRAWSDTPAYEACAHFTAGGAVEVTGEFFYNASFGLDARRWELRSLRDEEVRALYEGDDDTRALLDADFDFVAQTLSAIADPRLKALCENFLGDYGPRFRRAAAARHNHHAFRGGLLRHTAQMLRSAVAICLAYPALNRDLMVAGVLFHDCGKLWEMCPPEQGFDIPRETRGELLGHISMGIEVANALWRKLPLDQWKELAPPSDEVRIHLLHLIASHHGQLEFGSPVEPKTPEAIALHFLDNLDARLEMIAVAYEKQPEIAPRVHERVRALNVFPVKGLPRFAVAPPGQTES